MSESTPETTNTAPVQEPVKSVAEENPPAEGDTPSEDDSRNPGHVEDDDPESHVGDEVDNG